MFKNGNECVSVNALSLSAPTASVEPPVDGDLDNDAMNREGGDSSGSSSREHADERPGRCQCMYGTGYPTGLTQGQTAREA